MRTTEYYNMSVDRLLVQPLKDCPYTTEELLLMGEGSGVIFYDNSLEVMHYADERMGKNVKVVLNTINERIAYVME